MSAEPVVMPGKKAKAYAVPASAFEEKVPAAAESPAERAARKAAKAARKEAKASAKAGGAPAAAPEAAAEEKPKKRKRAAPTPFYRKSWFPLALGGSVAAAILLALLVQRARASSAPAVTK